MLVPIKPVLYGNLDPMRSEEVTVHPPRTMGIVVVATAVLIAATMGLILGGSQPSLLVLVSALIALSSFGLSFVVPSMALVLLIFAGRFEVGPVVSGLHDVAFWTLAGSVVALLLRHRARSPVLGLNLVLITFFSFVGWVVVSLGGTAGSIYGTEKAFRVAVYGTAFTLIPLVYFVNQERVVRFLLAFVLFIDAFAGFSVLQALMSTGLEGIQRIAPPGGGPVTLARLVGLAAITCIGLSLFSPRHGRWLTLNGLILTLVCFLTGSRAPALFLVITIALLPVLLALNTRQRGQSIKTLVVFLLLAVLAVPAIQLFAVADYPFVQRFELLLAADQGESVNIRRQFYSKAIQEAEDARWLGLGVGGWALEVEGVDERAYPHNLFLEVLVEQGVPGFLSLLLYTLGVLAIGLRAIARASPVDSRISLRLVAFLAFLYALLVAQTSGDLYDNRFIWFYGVLVLIVSTEDLFPSSLSAPKLQSSRELSSRSLKRGDGDDSLHEAAYRRWHGSLRHPLAALRVAHRPRPHQAQSSDPVSAGPTGTPWPAVYAPQVPNDAGCSWAGGPAIA
jgi:O-antigen ligase